MFVPCPRWAAARTLRQCPYGQRRRLSVKLDSAREWRRVDDPNAAQIYPPDAFGYFAAAYGVTFIAPQGVSTESEVSAKDVAKIITQIRKQKIPAVFLENVTDERLLRRIAQEGGARIGGTLYSDALTDEKGPAPTYLDMMRHNVKQLPGAVS